MPSTGNNADPRLPDFNLRTNPTLQTNQSKQLPMSADYIQPDNVGIRMNDPSLVTVNDYHLYASFEVAEDYDFKLYNGGGLALLCPLRAKDLLEECVQANPNAMEDDLFTELIKRWQQRKENAK